MRRSVLTPLALCSVLSLAACGGAAQAPQTSPMEEAGGSSAGLTAAPTEEPFEVTHAEIVGADGAKHGTVWVNDDSGRLDIVVEATGLTPGFHGIHLHATTDTVFLEGADAGVSCASHHDPRAGTTFTVLSNTSHGAWPPEYRSSSAIFSLNVSIACQNPSWRKVVSWRWAMRRSKHSTTRSSPSWMCSKIEFFSTK